MHPESVRARSTVPLPLGWLLVDHRHISTLGISSSHLLSEILQWCNCCSVFTEILLYLIVVGPGVLDRVLPPAGLCVRGGVWRPACCACPAPAAPEPLGAPEPPCPPEPPEPPEPPGPPVPPEPPALPVLLLFCPFVPVGPPGPFPFPRGAGVGLPSALILLKHTASTWPWRLQNVHESSFSWH